MAQLTISVPDGIESSLHRRAARAGFQSDAEYIVALLKDDCEREELDAILEARSDGPFVPLETDWKEKVREASARRG